MTALSLRLLFWAPRALGIAFAAFTGVFALDVFNEGGGFWVTLAALAVHLIPTALIITILALAWHWEWIGALMFTAAGLLYVTMAIRHIDWILLIAGPLFVIAALFFINWLKHDQLHQAQPQGH